VVFIFVVSNVPMLMIGGVMVLFIFMVGNMLMILTSVTAVPWWCLP
jgi:hypothetical protein